MQTKMYFTVFFLSVSEAAQERFNFLTVVRGAMSVLAPCENHHFAAFGEKF